MPAATAASTGTSSGGGSKPARKSRVLKRKTDHSVIERRRREKINDRLIRLQTLVPACQEEAFEVLGNKPLPKHRRASRSNGMNEQAWSQEEMLVKMQSEMVLEKLCIISHTYGERYCASSLHYLRRGDEMAHNTIVTANRLCTVAQIAGTSVSQAVPVRSALAPAPSRWHRAGRGRIAQGGARGLCSSSKRRRGSGDDQLELGHQRRKDKSQRKQRRRRGPRLD